MLTMLDCKWLVVSVYLAVGIEQPFMISQGWAVAKQYSNQLPTEDKYSGPNPLQLLVLLPSTINGSTQSMESLGQYPSWHNTLPAMETAVEQINNRSDFLTGHKLELIHKEVGCEITTNTLEGLTSGMFSGGSRSEQEQKIVGIIGPLCTRSSMQVSSITNHHPKMRGILLHSSGSPRLANRTEFPYSLGILGSTQSLVDLLLKIIHESGWSDISVLCDMDQLYYSTIMKDFVASIDKTVGVVYLSAFTLTHYPLNEILSSRLRIVFMFAPLEHAKRIMCLAYHMNLGYPKYQWVLVSQWVDDFISTDITFYYSNKEYNCSFNNLEALEGSFFVNYQTSTATHANLFPNITFDEFLGLYKQRVDKYNSEHEKFLDVSPSRWDYPLYDAVWAWAIVLNKLIMVDNITGTLKFGDLCFNKAALREFYLLDFQGLSGHINFNVNTGFVYRTTNLYQTISGSKRLLAYNNGTEVVTLQHFTTLPDRKRVVGLPHTGIVGFFLATHCVMLIAVVTIHIFTFMCYNTKFVKASSPKLIQLAFIGAYIHILAMFLNSIFFTTELSPLIGGIICQTVWTWFLPISFTLMMGIITVRAWRLYRIFIHYLKPGDFISNPKLLAILLVLVLFDVLLAITWTTIDPNRFEFLEYVVKNKNVQEVYLDQSCNSKYNFLWMGLFFTYKFGLLSIMIVLSILTYKIPNRTFSTTLLRVFSYSYSSILIIGFAIYFLVLFIDRHSSISYIVLSVVLTMTLLTFVIFVVFPPLVPVMKFKIHQFF